MRYLVKASYVNYMMLMDYELDSPIYLWYSDESEEYSLRRLTTDMKHLFLDIANLKAKKINYYIEKQGVTFEQWMMLI